MKLNYHSTTMHLRCISIMFLVFIGTSTTFNSMESIPLIGDTCSTWMRPVSTGLSLARSSSVLEAKSEFLVPTYNSVVQCWSFLLLTRVFVTVLPFCILLILDVLEHFWKNCTTAYGLGKYVRTYLEEHGTLPAYLFFATVFLKVCCENCGGKQKFLFGRLYHLGCRGAPAAVRHFPQPQQ